MAPDYRQGAIVLPQIRICSFIQAKFLKFPAFLAPVVPTAKRQGWSHRCEHLSLPAQRAATSNAQGGADILRITSSSKASVLIKVGRFPAVDDILAKLIDQDGLVAPGETDTCAGSSGA
jgi:hypothetical protein